jgi:LPS sulfotransferase NodH
MNPEVPSAGAMRDRDKSGPGDTGPAKRKKSHRDLPRVCFVIARPRSGTTVFSKMLSSHPRVVCVGEVFNQSNERSYFHFLQKQVLVESDALFPTNSTKNFLKFVDACREYATAKKHNCKVVVLDVKYDQAHLLCEAWWKLGQLPKIFFLIREKKWRVIDIHRNDLVSLCISNQVAMQTKVYHSSALAEGEKQTAKIRINPDQILRDVQVTRAVYESIGKHFKSRREYRLVNYEEMFDAEGIFSEELVDDLSTFLGVQNFFDRNPKLQKLLSEDIIHHVENASELRALLDSSEVGGKRVQDTPSALDCKESAQ